jgi:hypothetical protein
LFIFAMLLSDTGSGTCTTVLVTVVCDGGLVQLHHVRADVVQTWCSGGAVVALN